MNIPGRNSIVAAPTACPPTFAYFAGDSNTNGQPGTLTTTGNNFVALCGNALGSNFSVKNGGYSSQTSAQIMSGLPGYLEFAWHNPYLAPTIYAGRCVMSIMMGENDPSNSFTLADSQAQFRKLKLLLEPKGIPFILTTAIERVTTSGVRTYQSWFTDFNGWLVDAAVVELGAVAVVDLRANNQLNRYQPGVNDASFQLVNGTYSGIHWGDVAHALYAAILVPKIQQAALY